jgi:hypothetical protein
VIPPYCVPIFDEQSANVTIVCCGAGRRTAPQRNQLLVTGY